MSRSVPVLVPLPLETPFDYAADLELRAGDYVEVPFGPRQVIGVVWDAAPGRAVASERLKPVRRRQRRVPAPWSARSPRSARSRSSRASSGSSATS